MATNQETGNGREYLPFEYEELQLPEMTDAEGQIRQVEIILNAAEEQEIMAELDGLQGSDALRVIDVFAAKKATETIQAAGLSTDIALNAMEVIRARSFDGVTTKGEEFALMEFAAKIQRLKYELIEKWIQTGEKTGINEIGRAEYARLSPAMAATDLLYLKMQTEQFPIDSRERELRGLTNPCAVVREVDGVIKEAPLHQAYPKEIAAIVDAYDKLIAQLEGKKGDELVMRKLPYYMAVREAMKTSNIQKLVEADRLLAGQIVTSADVFHVHAVEDAYMRDRVVRVPETSLRIPDKSAERVRLLSEGTKSIMIASWESPYASGLPGVAKSLPLLRKSNNTPRHVTGGGMGLTFVLAGQIIPNDFGTRAAGGVDSTIDQTTAVQRFPEYLTGFTRLFDAEMCQRLFEPHINHDRASGVDTAGHEFGHTAALIASTFDRLGGRAIVNSYIEEWKATVSGMIGRLYIPYLQGQVDIEDLKEKIPYLLGRAGRYATKRNSDYAAAYFRKSIMLTRLMNETGILVETGDAANPWDINLDDDRVLKFYEALFQEWRQIMQIYDSGHEADLRAFLSKNLTVTPFLEHMCRRIPCKDKTGADMPGTTPAEIVQLPRTESVVTAAEAVAEVAGEVREQFAAAM